MDAFTALLILAATGAGLIGGLFFAFSNFIMQALGELPEVQGAAAMRAINRTVLNPLFFVAFFGTGVLCLLVAILSLAEDLSWLVPVGAALYLLGSIGVTIVGNVPLNERLARAQEDAAIRSEWRHYLVVWTRWNHVRTVASLAAAALFAAALAA